MQREGLSVAKQLDRQALCAALDDAVSKIVWMREQGRCYTCGNPATDAAHLLGRRHMATRWDVEHTGNVHLLCRRCHQLDHMALLVPSYREIFTKRQGEAAYRLLTARSVEVVHWPDFKLADMLEELQNVLHS